MSNESQNNNAAELGRLRREIDDLDKQIIDLLNKRAEVVVRVGQLKRSDGTPIYSPDRESVILQRVAQLGGGGLEPLLLYILTHELVHVVRFQRAEHLFSAASELRLAEEERVHRITLELLAAGGLALDSGLRTLLSHEDLFEVELRA